MKNLRIFPLIAVISLCNMAVYAMEVSKNEHVFIRMTVLDIQQLARTISQETGEDYQIITLPVLVERCLQMLGLDEANTPLDVKYHYELLKQKISKDNPLYEAVEKAYTQLMRMFFVFDNYQGEIANLSAMNFAQVEALELEGTMMKPNQFKERKNTLINNTINAAQEHRRQYFLNKQIALSNDIYILLKLPANASSNAIEVAYNKYIEANLPDRFIALKNMKKISNQYLKNKLLEIEQVKRAYAEYLKAKMGTQ